MASLLRLEPGTWVIGERMAGTADPMPFNAAFPEECAGRSN
jgi:hypothetical protein